MWDIGSGTYSGARVVKVLCNGRHTTRKSMSEQFQLQIPPGKLPRFCAEKRYGTYENVKGRHKAELSTLSDAEIILAYNGELRGLANYYALAHSVKGEMNKLAHIWQTSLLKTLAHKHKTHVTTIAKRLKTDDGYVHTVQEKEKTRTIRLFRLKDLKTSPSNHQSIDIPPNTFALTLSRSELIRRINAGQCEYCETKEGSVPGTSHSEDERCSKRERTLAAHHDCETKKDTRSLRQMPSTLTYRDSPWKEPTQEMSRGRAVYG